MWAWRSGAQHGKSAPGRSYAVASGAGSLQPDMQLVHRRYTMPHALP